MGALPARVTLVPLRSFRDRINHKIGHGVPDFEISARTKVKMLEYEIGNLKNISSHGCPTCTGNLSTSEIVSGTNKP